MVNSTHCSLSCFLFAHCFYHSPWFRWRTGCIQIWAKYKYIYPSTFLNRNVNILLAESHHSVSNGKSRTAEWRLSSSAILIHATVDPNSTSRRLQISGCEFSAWWREPPRTPLSVDKIGTRNLRSLNIVVMPLSVMVFQTRITIGAPETIYLSDRILFCTVWKSILDKNTEWGSTNNTSVLIQKAYSLNNCPRFRDYKSLISKMFPRWTLWTVPCQICAVGKSVGHICWYACTIDRRSAYAKYKPVNTYTIWLSLIWPDH